MILTSIAFGVAFSAAALAHPEPLSSDKLDGLTRTQSSQFDVVYARDGIEAHGLNVAAVSIQLERDTDQYALGRRDLERLRSGFENDLRASSADGEGSVTLEVTLTELIPNRSYSSFGTRIARHRRSFGSGRAAMEAIYRDTATGDILMVILDERAGPELFRDAHAIVPGNWHDAENILDDWADELPAAL